MNFLWLAINANLVLDEQLTMPPLITKLLERKEAALEKSIDPIESIMPQEPLSKTCSNLTKPD